MEAPILRLASEIEALARAQARASPPPRGLPFLALEHPSGTSYHLLDALSTHGIFRKYERVLDLGAGLGGSSRWLAARLGCEVVGTTADAAEAAAGTLLTRRAQLAGQVRLLPAASDALPVRARYFTHVWMLETLPRAPNAIAALTEAHRALRPGGCLALQELVRADRAEQAWVPGWRLVTAAERIAALGAVGFVELVVRDRTAEATERSPRLLAVRAQLMRRLRTLAAHDAGLARIVGERQAVVEALAGGALRLIQVTAKRA
jgi:SAM-dependent methyltransferase